MTRAMRCADGIANVTVTSTGYNGTGFTPAYSGEPSSASATATIVPLAVRLAATLDPPQIIFGGKDVAGQTTSVVVGQQISLSGKVPTQACVQLQGWNSTPQDGRVVGGASATMTSGFTLKALPANSANIVKTKTSKYPIDCSTAPNHKTALDDEYQYDVTDRSGNPVSKRVIEPPPMMDTGPARRHASQGKLVGVLLTTRSRESTT